MKVGVVVLNFGEPERPDAVEVTAFLERIFLANARLEDGAARERARELAGRRAPGLLAEYRRIGGSPLNAQTEAQTEALRAVLSDRGRDAVVATGLQFTSPDIRSAVRAVRDGGADRLVGLPLYPLCGPSTTAAALAELRAAVAWLEWAVPVTGIAGWHTRSGYTALRADGIRRFARRVGAALEDPGTRVVFSAHGTPVRYLREGSRYDLYVEDHCARLAAGLGVDGVVGYQNHANRAGVRWTEPAVEDVLGGLEADRVVVVPVSFMQEQSETLHELDHELRAVAESRGLEFHRVPVPHDDPRFGPLLADVLEPVLDDDPSGYRPCRCAEGAVCLTRDLSRAGS